MDRDQVLAELHNLLNHQHRPPEGWMPDDKQRGLVVSIHTTYGATAFGDSDVCHMRGLLDT
jgi:hypothetical protein